MFIPLVGLMRSPHSALSIYKSCSDLLPDGGVLIQNMPS